MNKEANLRAGVEFSASYHQFREESMKISYPANGEEGKALVEMQEELGAAVLPILVKHHNVIKMIVKAAVASLRLMADHIERCGVILDRWIDTK